MLCHNDEQGIIYEIDHSGGNIRQRFYLGKSVLYLDDLEGIAAIKSFAQLLLKESK